MVSLSELHMGVDICICLSFGLFAIVFICLNLWGRNCMQTCMDEQVKSECTDSQKKFAPNAKNSIFNPSAKNCTLQGSTRVRPHHQHTHKTSESLTCELSWNHFNSSPQAKTHIWPQKQHIAYVGFQEKFNIPHSKQPKLHEPSFRKLNPPSTHKAI